MELLPDIESKLDADPARQAEQLKVVISELEKRYRNQRNKVKYKEVQIPA